MTFSSSSVAAARAEGVPNARIYDFASAQARREERRAGAIPADVWAEVEAANLLFEELEQSGRRVMLDDERLDGRLVIALCDLEGRLLRSVPAADLVTGVVALDGTLDRNDGQEGAA